MCERFWTLAGRAAGCVSNVQTASQHAFNRGMTARTIAGLLVDATWESTKRGLWAASGLEQAAPTVRCAREIKKGFPIVDQLAGRREGFAHRAGVDVGLLVET